MRSRVFLLAALSLVFVRPALVHAYWFLNGTAIATAADDQAAVVIVADGAGGAIMAWEDLRNGSVDIYAQRINAVGVVQWAANGVPLCTEEGDQYNPQLISDGAGGAIVVWYDTRGADYDIYAQRVNASGAVQWTLDGVVLSAAPDDQSFPTLTSDGAGGAIVAWDDLRNGLDDVYAQRIDALGAVQWAVDGVALCTAAQPQFHAAIIPDASGGAIVSWADYRNNTNWDIYAQRVNGSGTIQWAANGVAICTAVNNQDNATITPDGSGGGIVAWYDVRNGSTSDIYAQKVNTSGIVQWTANGVVLCAAASDQYFPIIISDNASGAIVTWYDLRTGSAHIYARRVDSTGTPQWTANGVALCTATGDQYNPQLVPDGAGGAIVTWEDVRTGSTGDVYAQRVNATGSALWTANGVKLCNATGDQFMPVIAADGAAGAIIAWTDVRGGTFSDVYALRAFANGTVPTGIATRAPSFALEVGDNHPNPFASGTTMELVLRNGANVTMEVFDAAGRRVRAMDLGRRDAGSSDIRFDGRDDRARTLPSGVYFCRVRAGSEAITKKLVIAR
jgi:predicted lipoprotein with Yx(FWY)xxD motif